jgi:tRNA dimethylallyltransferase
MPYWQLFYSPGTRWTIRPLFLLGFCMIGLKPTITTALRIPKIVLRLSASRHITEEVPNCMSKEMSTPKSLPNNRLLILAGPTGVGKSDIAAEICKSYHGIIVSADSVQAFKGAYIGANQPTREEIIATPHLLIDRIDSNQPYTVAEWRRDAHQCIQSLLLRMDPNSPPSILSNDITRIRQRHNYHDHETILPVVVGGTMLYLQWLVHGQPDASRPTTQAVEKAQRTLEKFQSIPEQDKQWEQALQHVSSWDQKLETRLKSLEENDWYRLRRTMEITYTAIESGEPLDSLFTGERDGSLESLGYDVRCIFVCPNDRQNHTQVIDQRCEDMLLRGLLTETTDLLLSNKLHDMAKRAIGYRQALEYLQREDPQPMDVQAFDAFLHDFTAATRRYAKRQMQWFRKDPNFCFVPVSLQDTKEERVRKAAERVQNLLLMSRDKYEAELLPKNDEGQWQESYLARMQNEEQGKKMKLYQYKKHTLIQGSQELESIIQQADDCTFRMQGKTKINKLE